MDPKSWAKTVPEVNLVKRFHTLNHYHATTVLPEGFNTSSQFIRQSVDVEQQPSPAGETASMTQHE
jgi:penicillin V acylase-like amidase (Ntn superfamily)